MKEDISFESLAVREWPDPRTTKPHILPIYATSSFEFEDIQQAVDIFARRASGHTYSRYGNPTVQATASKIAAMEMHGSQQEAYAVMTNSGMAAIQILLSGLLKQGDKLLTQPNVYGGTTELLQKIVSGWGIGIEYADLTDLAQVEACLKADETIRMIYFETPANPTLACIDIAALTALVRHHHRWSAIDNTFATPFLQRPLQLGVDFVLHSTTKFLNGHGNSMGGIVLGTDKQLVHDKIWMNMKLTGANCSPFDAWLVYQGMKTLALRMERHCSNAMLLAETLEKHPRVIRVNYPGLASHPDHLIAKKQMTAFGGMMSFELEGGFQDALDVLDRLQFCSLAPTLGDVDTLLLHPASSSHVNVSAELRKKAGIPDGMIRVSVGIEDPQDVLNDILNALEQ